MPFSAACRGGRKRARCPQNTPTGGSGSLSTTFLIDWNTCPVTFANGLVTLAFTVTFKCYTWNTSKATLEQNFLQVFQAQTVAAQGINPHGTLGTLFYIALGEIGQLEKIREFLKFSKSSKTL